MIATCKFCQTIIAPAAILKLSPRVLVTLPSDVLDSMKFTAAVTEHVRAAHPEYLQHVQQLAGNFIGHCTLSTVDPVGESANVFRTQCAHDNAILRVYWEALPNAPHPDIMAKLEDEGRLALAAARKLDLAQHLDQNPGIGALNLLTPT